MLIRRLLSTLLVTVAVVGTTVPATAAPEGTLTIGVHVTLVNRWLDPGETEGLITPFMVLDPLHDALVKPMPGGISTPSLAESWTLSKDNLTYEFVLRKNARFHNGDPVTAEDVKFSFERYKGASATLLKSKVKEVQTPAPNRVRIVLKEPWADRKATALVERGGRGIERQLLCVADLEARAPVGDVRLRVLEKAGRRIDALHRFRARAIEDGPRQDPGSAADVEPVDRPRRRQPFQKLTGNESAPPPDVGLVELTGGPAVPRLRPSHSARGR